VSYIHPLDRATLTPGEARVLDTLRRARGEVVPFDALRPGASTKATPTLRYEVHALRCHGHPVVAVRGRGYRLVGAPEQSDHG
jgi:hypothetical protein